MAEVIINNFEEIQHCPVCTGQLKNDTTKGMVIKVCQADRHHGYFTVNHGSSNEWYIEYNTYAP